MLSLAPYDVYTQATLSLSLALALSRRHASGCAAVIRHIFEQHHSLAQRAWRAIPVDGLCVLFHRGGGLAMFDVLLRFGLVFTRRFSNFYENFFHVGLNIYYCEREGERERVSDFRVKCVSCAGGSNV